MCIRDSAHVALTSGLTDVDQVMIRISDNTYGCAANKRNHSHFSGRKSQGCVLAFLSHQLCAVSGGTNQLAASSGIQLNVVYLLSLIHI